MQDAGQCSGLTQTNEASSLPEQSTVQENINESSEEITVSVESIRDTFTKDDGEQSIDLEGETQPLLNNRPVSEGDEESGSTIEEEEKKKKQKLIPSLKRSLKAALKKQGSTPSIDTPRKKVRWVDEEEDVELGEVVGITDYTTEGKERSKRGRHHRKKRGSRRKLAEVKEVSRYIPKKVKVPKWCRTCLRYKFSILISCFVALLIFLLTLLASLKVIV